MKRNLLLILALVGLLCLAGQLSRVAAHSDSQPPHAFTPATIPWGPAPPIVPPGAQLAVLEGDPTASSGDFTVRLKMPDG